MTYTPMFTKPTGVSFIDTLRWIAGLTDTGSGQILGLSIALLIYGALFLTFKAYDMTRAFVASSFIVSILAVLLGILGLVNDFFIYLGIILFIVSFFLLRHKTSQGEV